MDKIGIVIFFFYFLFGLQMMLKAKEKIEQIKQNQEKDTQVPEKYCPPHLWSFKDNQNGGTYISCDRCKKLPGQLDVSDTTHWDN